MLGFSFPVSKMGIRKLVRMKWDAPRVMPGSEGAPSTVHRFFTAFRLDLE